MIFLGRNAAEAPALWPPDSKNRLSGKDPEDGKDGRKEEKGTREDEMDGWRHRLNGHESEQTQGVGDGQGGLALCIPWGHKESATAERPNKRNNPNTKSKIKVWGVGREPSSLDRLQDK